MPFVNCPKALWNGIFIAFIGVGIAIGTINYSTMLQFIGIPVVI